MVFILRIKYIAAAIAIMLTSTVSPVSAISDEQKDTLVQNCGNIKQSLIMLQHADSRTRTYLGSAYEAVSSRFITPLNLRLIKNNSPSEELFKIQNKFTAAQVEFRSAYVEYMRELENLIATDCSAHPEDFYRKLESTRDRRETLRKTTVILAGLVESQYKAVESLTVDL